MPLPALALLAPAVARTAVWQPDEIVAAAVRLPVALAIAILVVGLVRRVPWPRPFRARFAALHLVAAPLAALAWHATATALQAAVGSGAFTGPFRDQLPESLFVGAIVYALVAGVAYAVAGAERAARAEALAARTQLAALRAQLQPHFLFNALHTVVQLIPLEPRRAAEAAELLADLLRATLETRHDEVTLAEEWRFVSRYLALERIRFGDRLVVRAELPPELLDACVPAFALQTLVENAVHHGAAPRVAPTEIVVAAAGSAAELTLSVRNTADAPAEDGRAGAGTGLARLRERLAVLHGSAARLACGPIGDGYEAVLALPRARGSAA